ncbi:MAG: ATP-dependent helicase HrpB [Desulfovibrionales bacterium]|nr:ATP-dependent helicase HrpB [Desulfovibrionales bacterium]
MITELLAKNNSLPIDFHLQAIADSLAVTPNCVLHAPPGAGKTTRVPLALLDSAWRNGRRILLLEPRRLAARTAAARLASTLGEPVGKTVGYRIKNDTRISAETQIEVVTEGILTRMIQQDPELPNVGCIIFDEFHERSLHADLGLALAIEIQGALRDDLRLLVMSATLDTEEVSALLENCPVISSQGRSYPVEIKHVPLSGASNSRIEQQIPAMLRHVVATIRHALTVEPGSILVFLPGASEIRYVAEQLAGTIPDDILVAPLFGTLSQKEQDAAILAAPAGTRKIVLSTSIAETSLTIEGIRVVIDSGLSRSMRFSPATGMDRLITLPVSLAEANQRTGRAGRLEKGICYRLWSEVQENSFRAFAQPEIKDSDLAPLALELAQWGATGMDGLSALAWMTPPPASNYQHALLLLQQLDILDSTYTITEHGKQVARLPLHPRFGHMVLKAHENGYGHTAAVVASLLSERLPNHIADIRYLLEDIVSQKNSSSSKAIAQNTQTLCRRLKISSTEAIQPSLAGLCIIIAYPDRIGMLQNGSRTTYKLSNGRRATLSEDNHLAGNPFIAVAELNDASATPKIWRGAPVTLETIETLFSHHIIYNDTIAWDEQTKAVQAHKVKQLYELTLATEPSTTFSEEAVTAALLDGIRTMGLSSLPWSKDAIALRNRLYFLHTTCARTTSKQSINWPNVSEKGLLHTIEDWLSPFLTGMRKAADLKQLDMEQILLAMLDWSTQKAMDTLAPTHFTVPSGSAIRIDYTEPERPVLPVKLQEMFGATETPAICNSQIPLTVHLLSPAGRPLQVTRDLISFWENGYPSVRAEMRGRYPKHPWPENPLTAQATRKTNRALNNTSR